MGLLALLAVVGLGRFASVDVPPPTPAPTATPPPGESTPPTPETADGLPGGHTEPVPPITDGVVTAQVTARLIGRPSEDVRVGVVDEIDEAPVPAGQTVTMQRDVWFQIVGDSSRDVTPGRVLQDLTAPGLTVDVSMPAPTDVVRGIDEVSPEDPLRVTGLELHPGVPRVATATITAVAGQQATIDVPLSGGGALQLDVRWARATPGGATAPASAQIRGARVPAPDPGQARTLIVDEGPPVWIANADEGVFAVDARATGSFRGMRWLASWCPGNQTYADAISLQRFDAAGRPLDDRGTGWLRGYRLRTTGDDADRVVDRTVTILDAVDGPAADEDLPPLPVAWCDPEVEDRRAQPFPLTDYPTGDVADLPPDARVHLPNARVQLDRHGRGLLCPPRPDLPFCGLNSSPVQLPAGFHDGPLGPRAVVELPVVATIRDAVIVELWATAPLPPPTWVDVRGDPAARRQLVQLLGPQEHPDLASGMAPNCAEPLVMAPLRRLDLLPEPEPEEAVSFGTHDGQLGDGAVPEGATYGADRRDGRRLVSAACPHDGLLGDGTPADTVPREGLAIREIRGERLWSLTPVG